MGKCKIVIYVNKKDEKEYTKRPGAYAIVEGEDGKIAIVCDEDKDCYYFGGGIEKGETPLEALRRELIEECGYSIKDINFFTEVGEFLKSKTRGYIEVLASIYVVKLNEFVKEPVEKDHNLVWIKPEDFRNKLLRNWQNYVLDLYIEYKEYYDGTITDNVLKDKIVFWDIDGTLASYRFNGHVSSSDGSDNGMSLDEINEGIFLKRVPSRFMQNILKNADVRKNIVLGHVLCDKSIEDKNVWLDRFFPMIEERIFIKGSSKGKAILEYCEKNSIDIKDVVFIDDSLNILREAERLGINSWHISSFLDYKRGIND